MRPPENLRQTICPTFILSQGVLTHGVKRRENLAQIIDERLSLLKKDAGSNLDTQGRDRRMTLMAQID